MGKRVLSSRAERRGVRPCEFLAKGLAPFLSRRCVVSGFPWWAVRWRGVERSGLRRGEMEASRERVCEIRREMVDAVR